MSKKKAFSEMPASMIVIGVLIIMLFMIVNALIPFMIKQNMDNIGQKYIVKMLEDGYLTSENRSDMEKEIAEINGIESYRIIATNSKVKEYGDDVNLIIEYKSKEKDVQLNGLMPWIVEVEVTRSIKKSLASTAVI